MKLTVFLLSLLLSGLFFAAVLAVVAVTVSPWAAAGTGIAGVVVTYGGLALSGRRERRKEAEFCRRPAFEQSFAAPAGQERARRQG